MKDKSNSVKKDKLEKIRQNIFTSRTDKERKMWEAILKKLQDEPKKQR